MVLAVRVPRNKAEEIRKKLIEEGVFDTRFKIKATASEVYIPVRTKPPGLEVLEVELEPRAERRSFRDRLREILGDKAALARRAFDFIGDIAVIEIPPELEAKAEDIGRALLESVPAVKAVYMKQSPISGVERVRKLRHLAGERRTETVHTENGVKIKLDIGKVYFSPRLSYERQRIAEQVKEGETIVDMFAGTGAFSLVIARRKKVKIYAIDINKTAVEYLRQNIGLNRLRGEIIPIYGDCRKVAPRNTADRVIMNLPGQSHHFLETAFQVLRGSGVIHFYTLGEEPEPFSRGEKIVEEKASSLGIKVRIGEKRVVRSYAPRRYIVVLDVVVEHL